MFLHVKHICRVGRLWAGEAFTVRTTSNQEFSLWRDGHGDDDRFRRVQPLLSPRQGGAMGLWLGLGIMQFLEVHTSCSPNFQLTSGQLQVISSEHLRRLGNIFIDDVQKTKGYFKNDCFLEQYFLAFSGLSDVLQEVSTTAFRGLHVFSGYPILGKIGPTAQLSGAQLSGAQFIQNKISRGSQNKYILKFTT